MLVDLDGREEGCFEAMGGRRAWRSAVRTFLLEEEEARTGTGMRARR
jgi:hypothetical protein